MSRFWKAILAAAGGLSGAGVAAIAHTFGVELDPALAAAVATIIATAAVALGPANTKPAPPTEAPASGSFDRGRVS